MRVKFSHPKKKCNDQLCLCNFLGVRAASMSVKEMCDYTWDTVYGLDAKWDREHPDKEQFGIDMYNLMPRGDLFHIWTNLFWPAIAYRIDHNIDLGPKVQKL